MIEAALLLRIVPYALAGYVAYRKGFKWLTVLALWVSLTAVLVFSFSPAQEIRALFGSVTALLMLRHAIDLRSRV